LACDLPLTRTRTRTLTLTLTLTLTPPDRLVFAAATPGSWTISVATIVTQFAVFIHYFVAMPKHRSKPWHARPCQPTHPPSAACLHGCAPVPAHPPTERCVPA
jgi:hypothetical protein